MGKRLTARMVENLGPGRYSDGSGAGLMLWVNESGSRSWVQRIRVNGKRTDIGLGGFPVVTLKEARDLALENKRTAHQGRDPLAEKRRAKVEAAGRLTFSVAAERTCDELAHTWRGKKEPLAFMSSMKTHAFPHFGNIDVSEISSADIRRAVLACRQRVPSQSRKVQHRILGIFRWCVAEGLRKDNPATTEALALPKMDHRHKGYLALPYTEVAGAVDTVKVSGAWEATKLALEFAVLTAARSGEVRGARWAEMDMESAVWVVPAERMKMGREHRVPLSGRALEVLAEAQSLHDASGLVFPSVRGKELSDATLSKLVRELGIPSTVHGFRSSFRTWCQERTNVSGEVAEAALAHVKADKVEAAYARSDLFEKRRRLMERRAAYLSETNGKIARIG